jgi:hypothetical protein
VLAVGVAISYLGCAPLFIMSGREYAKGLERLKNSAIVRNTLRESHKINLSVPVPVGETTEN